MAQGKEDGGIPDGARIPGLGTSCDSERGDIH